MYLAILQALYCDYELNNDIFFRITMTAKQEMCIKQINRVYFDFLLTLKAIIGCDNPPHLL